MASPLAVILSPIPWSGLWTSRHAIGCELAGRGWRVLFVEPPANLLRRPSPPLEAPAAPPGLTVAPTRGYLPYGFLGGAPRAARAVVEANARRYARDVAAAVHGTPELLVNSFMPVLGYRVAEHLRPAVHVYHRADELRRYPSWRPAYSELEARVATQADHVVCVTEAVLAGIAAVRPDAAVIPNGVHSGPFAAATPDPSLEGLARPVVLLVGSVDHRADAGVLAAAGRAGTLVVAGPADPALLPPGAVHLGQVPHRRLPGLMAAADVGVVCYSPGWPGDVLKIYEYLAAGLPVVSTAFAGLGAAVRPEIHVVSAPEAMTAAIRRAAGERQPSATARRRAAAARHDWSHRVDQLLGIAGLDGAVREAS